MKNFFKQSIFLITSLLVAPLALTGVSAAPKNDLKILAIGNSFSEDATEYLALIASDIGIEKTTIGNAYIGGCSIEKHANNARENAPAYRYDKNTAVTLMSNAPKTNNTTLDTMLRDEDWDIITLQQSSPNSGKISTYNEDIDYLVGYIKERCPNAKLAWHMTWSYQGDYNSSAFSYYNNDQIKMYEMICNSVQEKIVKSGHFDYIIPVGTAIQNARTSEKGDTLTRDGLHLDLNIGRYIAGVTWVKTLGYSIDNLKTLPSRVRKTDLPLIREVVENALISPYSVTKYGEAAKVETTALPVTEEQTTAPDTETDSTQEKDGGITKNPIVKIAVICAVAIFAIGVIVGLWILKKPR